MRIKNVGNKREELVRNGKVRVMVFGLCLEFEFEFPLNDFSGKCSQRLEIRLHVRPVCITLSTPWNYMHCIASGERPNKYSINTSEFQSWFIQKVS